MAWLGFAADEGPVRQSESTAVYAAALERLRDDGVVYACDCTRSTFATWAAEHGSPWRGPGCPGRCRERDLGDDGLVTIRVELGGGTERWDDLLLGPQDAEPSAAGDLAVRDRHGNWTYGFAVVVDDLRQSISLVVRGEDLVEATAAQIRLARLLGRGVPPFFAHHPLIRKRDGAKLSKADGDTGVRDIRAAGRRPADTIGAAAAAVGLLDSSHPMSRGNVMDIVVRHVRRRLRS